MIQKLIQSLTTVPRIHCSIDQFAQVLAARVSLGCVFLLKLLDVAGAINQELQNLRRVGDSSTRILRGVWRGSSRPLSGRRDAGATQLVIDSADNRSAGILPAIVEASRLHIGPVG